MNFCDFNAVNVLKQILVVLEGKVIQQLDTHRVVLLLVLLVLILLIPCLHILYTPVINLVANKVHEHVKHDMPILSLPAQLERLPIVRGIDIGLGVPVIELEEQLFSVFGEVVIVFAQGL